MYELKFVDRWNDGVPSYYTILKDGELWSDFGYNNVWDAIAEIAHVDRQAADDLSKLYSS